VTTLNAVTCHYKCADDRWIILSLLNEEKQFPVFAKVIEREDLLADPRFENKPARHKHAADLIAILDKVFATKPLALAQDAGRQRLDLRRGRYSAGHSGRRADARH
jgi:crotonobetainyl-CoA:carnitine CoA-transferase CaiB-like acyl-CoA transferase